MKLIKIINELFDDKENELSIKTLRKNKQTWFTIIGNDDSSIEAHVTIVRYQDGVTEIGWGWTSKGKNRSNYAWSKITATCPKILKKYVDEHDPEIIIMHGMSPQHSRIYKSDSFLNLFKNYLGDKYNFDLNLDERTVFLLNKNGYSEEILDNALVNISN
jgi:hypothetical protein